MGYRASVSFDCGDLGKRVTLRYRLPDGMATDVVGILEHCDDASFGVRDKRSQVTYVSRADVVAGHVVKSPPWDKQDEVWEGSRPHKPSPG
ncbi:MAG: hypothetical protein ABR548_08960 [Actinomycetota bacterium]|nr:hypothetical protein [Actinomycetota bacterium]